MFLDSASCELPVDIDGLFEREAPVWAEIGSGSGYFLKAAAREHRDANFLAAEIHSSSVLRTYNRVRQASLSNVRLYHGDGRFFLRNLLSERLLSGLYVNFPDPWPKKKHADKRLLDDSFFRLLASRLVDTGRAYLTTDHRNYFCWALEQGRESRCFEIRQKPPPPLVMKSRYARKWESDDRSIYHAEFSKICHVRVQPTLCIVGMQHSVLEGSLPNLRAFEPIVHSFDGSHVVIKRALRPIGREAVLFDVHIEEEGLVQDVLLRVRDRGNGNHYILGVDPFGRPLATKGVAEAVRVLTDWFSERGLTVVDRSY